MAADITDKFSKIISGTTRPVATTLSAQKLSGATTASLTAATGWDTDTAVHGIMYRTDAGTGAKVAGSQIDWKATLSGTTLSNFTVTAGTDDTYAIGATVELAPTAAWGDDLVTGLLVSHDQDGTLKAGAVDNAAVIANDVVDSQHYVAGSIDTEHIADGAVTPAKLLAGTGTDWAWQSWTPTLSGRFNDAKWTKSCRYIQIGKTVFFYLDLTANTTTPMDGGTAEAIFSLPVTSATYTAAADMNIFSTQTRLLDSGTAAFNGLVSAQTTTTAKIRVFSAASTYLLEAAVTSTAPFTWTTSDQIVTFGSYEAA